MKNVVFLGPPYSGKGTQSLILVRKFSFIHISIGDILRNEMKNYSVFGKMVSNFVNKGKMVPNRLIMEIITEKIGKLDKTKNIIFDGIPRSIEQMIDFDKMLIAFNITNIVFIKLNVSTSELLKRAKLRSIKEKRADDQDINVINTRIEIYEKETIPVINFYSQSKDINQINGQLTIQNVHNNILNIL